ncbi:hypothetical protein TCAL_01449 [Tigriopus californicus]|uniref:Fibronectin type-III domain-containing protein n=1 Tax=Tigriopus californicus TaxID=6832 RepID=A0A553N6A3_TIGCA|nr:uncharacterized protein LOC131884997 [Tigriopus californicus]TRY60947.1 hypothetical protein TCAL_01449 [Tigriopus californicus]|eukprot:TCALIF_01449-PA protein Name:"Protein of unknown function" AED:0.00 eAED:0.00 QI:74/1/1/1/1/1/4/13/231
MTLQEHFGFKFRDETGKLLRSPVLSMEQAACGYDDSCRYRLSIYPYDIFKPCSKYNISIQIKGPDLYCTEPNEIYQIHVTKTEAPPPVLDLSFVNQINSFWKGQIKWMPPEISSCVHSYRVAYLEPSSGTSLPRGGTWHQGQTIDLYYDIEGLTRCTSYPVKVGAVATDGAQGEMHTKTFRTWGCFGSPPLALKSTAASLAPKSTNWYLVLLGVNTISHLGALGGNMCKDK